METSNSLSQMAVNLQQMISAFNIDEEAAAPLAMGATKDAAEA